MADSFIIVDFPALTVAILASICCALTGSFLVLRRQALMGDAMSHIVLPGIVVGFLVAGAIAAVPMLLGALAACLLSVFLIELIKRFGGIEPGAAMGVVFTAMFAAGVVLLEQKVGTRVHLDVHHALYGALELAYWPKLKSWAGLADPAVLSHMPRQIAMLLGVNAAVIAFVTLFYKELKITTFDPALAHTLGYSPALMNTGLMTIAAISAVAAFEAVGSILVIAMFICPAATARMLTDKLSVQLWLSAFFGGISAATGYFLAAWAPYWLGTPGALNAAGMIAIAAGLYQILAMAFAPQYGALGIRKKSELFQ